MKQQKQQISCQVMEMKKANLSCCILIEGMFLLLYVKSYHFTDSIICRTDAILLESLLIVDPKNTLIPKLVCFFFHSVDSLSYSINQLWIELKLGQRITGPQEKRTLECMWFLLCICLLWIEFVSIRKPIWDLVDFLFCFALFVYFGGYFICGLVMLNRTHKRIVSCCWLSIVISKCMRKMSPIILLVYG
jgi:hypothetical protein